EEAAGAEGGGAGSGSTRVAGSATNARDAELDYAHLQDAARRHLWMHFTRMSSYQDHEVPVMVRGDGPWVWDSKGRRYLDGLSGLFVVQAGHGRRELAEAAARQAGGTASFSLLSYAHPKAVATFDT